MKTKMIVVLFAGLFSLASCEKDFSTLDSDKPVFEKSGDLSSDGSLESFEFFSPSLEGNLLGDPATRYVNVYLPKSYTACQEKRFPVIYFLHGTPAWGNMLISPEAFEIFRQCANLAAPVDFPEEGFIDWVNNLVDEHGMNEAIIVMPDAKTFFGPSFYLNSVVQGDYEDYIVKDLVSYIDNHYRTIPHFNWRAVTGHCAGGYGALNLAMKYPKIFRYAGALSPSHFPEPTVLAIAGFMPAEDAIWEGMGAPAGPLPYNPLQPFKFANNSAYALAQAWLPNPEQPYLADLPFVYVEGVPVIIPELMAKWEAQNLTALVQKNRTGLKQLKTFYFDCGINDDLGMYQPNVLLHHVLTEMEVKHQFETFDGTHISHLYDRLGKLWVELSNGFPAYE